MWESERWWTFSSHIVSAILLGVPMFPREEKTICFASVPSLFGSLASEHWEPSADLCSRNVRSRRQASFRLARSQSCHVVHPPEVTSVSCECCSVTY
jgi:hypothetical protein